MSEEESRKKAEALLRRCQTLTSERVRLHRELEQSPGATRERAIQKRMADAGEERARLEAERSAILATLPPEPAPADDPQDNPADVLPLGVKPPISDELLITLELRYGLPRKSSVPEKYEDLWYQVLDAKQWTENCQPGMNAVAVNSVWPRLRAMLDEFMAEGDIFALAEMVRAWNAWKEGEGPEFIELTAEELSAAGIEWQSSEPFTMINMKPHGSTPRHGLKVKILAAIGHLQRDRAPTDWEVRDLLHEWDPRAAPNLQAIQKAIAEIKVGIGEDGKDCFLPSVMNHGEMPPQGFKNL